MNLSRNEIIELLSLQGEEEQQLFNQALKCKLENLDNTVHLRGLIEYSSKCQKNCFYCGLRASNEQATRYEMTEAEVLTSARQAYDLNYGSVAIQCGERNSEQFCNSIEHLCREIKALSNGELGITLSCGEQTDEVYARWKAAGAHRYLLRIESSTESLYYKIHPHDDKHSFNQRIACIESLKRNGYQTGTGVMIGLPFQTIEHLADDLIFFKDMDVAMVGMGPYIPHPDTPLWQYRDLIPSVSERLHLTYKMIAALRLIMPKINMVAATATQTLSPDGRKKSILAGANIIMPNLSLEDYRKDYLIYPDKAAVADTAKAILQNLDNSMQSIGHKILYGAWGDSRAFTEKH